jgi:prepilin-type N-terminal cleavage/methylation domain-containing protein
MNAARPGQVAMQRGFTLVELMVTLTILVMLLMIAVPAVLRAIQNAYIDARASPAAGRGLGA